MAKPVLGKSVRSDWFLLGRDFAVRTVSMETVQAVYFCFEHSQQIQNLQPKKRKKKCGYCHSSSRNYQKKLKKLKFYWDFRDEWRRRTFSERVQYYPEHPKTFDSETETSIIENQEAIDDFINQQKKTQTRKRLLIWTLFSATLKLMVWKMRKLKAYLRPSLTTFCRNLFERTEEKRRRIRASDSFQFSPQYKLTAILRRNIHLTYPRTMSSKNPEKSLQRSEITCSDTSTAKKINR